MGLLKHCFVIIYETTQTHQLLNIYSLSLQPAFAFETLSVEELITVIIVAEYVMKIALTKHTEYLDYSHHHGSQSAVDCQLIRTVITLERDPVQVQSTGGDCHDLWGRIAQK